MPEAMCKPVGFLDGGPGEGAYDGCCKDSTLLPSLSLDSHFLCRVRTAIVMNCNSASFRALQVARACAIFVESGNGSDANEAIFSSGRIVLNWYSR